MILRQFYVTENTNGPFFPILEPLLAFSYANVLTLAAPIPKRKVTRVLKTDISPEPFT